MFKRIRAAAFLFVSALAASAQSPLQSWQDVMRVSVKKAAHRGRNALTGLGAGAAIDAIAGAASHRDCAGFCPFYTTRGQGAAIVAAVLGVVGTAVGALIPTGGWRGIYRQ